MKLSQKIKHIKRHRKNKRFAKFADSFHFAAAECFLDGNENVFIVSPRLYDVMNRRKGCVPKNIKQSPVNCDRQIIAVPRDIIEFYNESNYLKEWCGIPNLHKEPDEKTKEELSKLPFSMFTNPELYMHIDKPIAPDITTLNGVRV
jgi:hypothetical protein